MGSANNQNPVSATVRWPSGLVQQFEGLPINHRVELVEGSPHFKAESFAPSPRSWAGAGSPSVVESLPSSSETWLIEPLKAPDFTLPDTAGDLRDLRSFQGRPLLLIFWTTDSPECRDQLQRLNKSELERSSGGAGIVAVNVDDPSAPHTDSVIRRERKTSISDLAGHARSSGHLQHRLSIHVRSSPRSSASGFLLDRRRWKHR